MEAMKVGNSVCLITGSARGLGKAFAVRLLTEGARVCISDVQTELGQETLKELRAEFGEERVVFVQCDVSKAEDFNRLFDSCESHFGVPCVDLLVNNAGINANLGWRKCMEVNIIGVMNGTEIALERMKKHGVKGSIINIASMAGVGTGAGFGEEILPYFVSKHGVVSLTRTLSANLPNSGIEVKALCPSWADTRLVVDVGGDENKKKLDAIVRRFGGLMTVEHVAGAFFSLLTECPGGSVMAVIKGLPFFIVPDTSDLLVRGLASMSLLINRVLGAKTVQVGDFKKMLTALLCFILFLFGMLLFLALVL